jgi:hypothetical protein
MTLEEYNKYEARKKLRRANTKKVFSGAGKGILGVLEKAPKVVEAGASVLQGVGDVTSGAGSALSGGFGGPITLAAIGAGALLLLRR